MKDKNVRILSSVLKLEREVVGVKFIDCKRNFDKLEINIPDKKGPFCYLVKESMNGKLHKADNDSITCDYGKYALGISKPDEAILEGRSYYHSGLYESNAIAKNIVKSMKYNKCNIHGVVIGPLRLLDDADVVIIASYAETIMRIMQGYAYKFGNPTSLSFFGNQAVCADLVSKPYFNNDINISVMCKGARAYGKFDKGELSVGLPINMFNSLVDGVVKTINPVNTSEEKNDILKSLDKDLKLDIKLDTKWEYGVRLVEYDETIRKRTSVSQNNGS